MDSLEGENSRRPKEGEPIEYPRFLTLDSFSLTRAYEMEFYCSPGAIEEARTRPYFITHRSKVDKIMVFVLTTRDDRECSLGSLRILSVRFQIKNDSQCVASKRRVH